MVIKESLTGEAFLSEFQSKFFCKIQMAIQNIYNKLQKKIRIGRQKLNSYKLLKTAGLFGELIRLKNSWTFAIVEF